MYSFCAKTYYVFFVQNQELLGKILNSGYIFVAIVMLSVVKLQRFGRCIFFSFISGIVHAVVAIQCCACVSLSPLRSGRHFKVWPLEGMLLFQFLYLFQYLLSFLHCYRIKWWFLIFS